MTRAKRWTAAQHMQHARGATDKPPGCSICDLDMKNPGTKKTGETTVDKLKETEDGLLLKIRTSSQRGGACFHMATVN